MRRSSRNLRCLVLSRLAPQARFGFRGAGDKRTLLPPGSGDQALPRRNETTSRTDRQGPRRIEAASSEAILVCDRDAFFGEALRNFLLAAGHSRVDVAATAREALVRLRRQLYGYVLIALSRPFSRRWRLAAVARRRQRT